MPQINASGTHESFYRAERATVTARVSIVSKDRSRSIADATSLHNWLAGRAKQLRESGDATWHAADAPTTWARKSYAEGDTSTVIIEHVTSSRVLIKLSNLDLVGSLIAELSESGAETHVSWALTDSSKRTYERKARKAAVGAARAIADDYADALGDRLVRVISILDAPGGYGGPAQARFSAASNGGGAEVTVAEITVSATVQCVFESA